MIVSLGIAGGPLAMGKTDARKAPADGHAADRVE